VTLVRSEGQAQMMGGGLLAAVACGSIWSRSHRIICCVTYARRRRRRCSRAPHDETMDEADEGSHLQHLTIGLTEGVAMPLLCTTKLSQHPSDLEAKRRHGATRSTRRTTGRAVVRMLSWVR
jgi:hypothetical protein